MLPGTAARSGEPRRSPRVLVDRSHEWLFAHDDLSERMLKPAGFEVVLCDASLNTKQRLGDFDVVVVQQVSNTFAFSAEEISLLKAYVVSGGCLVVIGNPRCPVADVAKAFEVRLKRENCQLPLQPTERLRTSFGADQTLRTGGVSCAVECSGPASTLIGDQRGTPVAVHRHWGRGRVICFADDGTYWDFCAQRDKDGKVPNVATTVALFRCLVPDWRSLGEGPAVVRVPAERELALPGMLVRYSQPVATQAQALLDLLPQVAASVAKRNGGRAPTDRFIVNVLAANGGGWSGGQEIGVQSGGDMAANVAVIAHELTHSWTGPLPGILSEGWASLVGMRVAAELGYREAADREKRSWQEQHARAEAGGQKLDIARAETTRSSFGPCEAKMMWLVEQLEAKHGADFMPRFLEICHSRKGRGGPTIQEVLYYFSLTAGEDLTAAYQAWGITYQPTTKSPGPR